MIILKIIFIILLLGYSSLVIYLVFKWNDIPFFKADCFSYHTTVSIVIPFRNEAKNLNSLVNTLLQLDYHPKLYEIIFVDDASDDNSLDVLKKKFNDSGTNSMSIKILSSQQRNKKAAIETGVGSAAGELILTTDADCHLPADWVKTIVCYYQNFGFDAASSPLIFGINNDFWSKLQQLEFISLIATGGASIAAGAPIMCNGANLAYKKSAFTTVGGYKEIDRSPGGDDVLLFRKLAKNKSANLVFIKAREGIVTTAPNQSLSEFIYQRIRWASKVTTDFTFLSFFIAAVVYLFNLSIIITGIGSFFSGEMFRIFIFLFSIKVIVDFIFFNSVLQFFKKKNLLFLILPAEIIYPFYVVIIGTLAPFKRYNWKGRNYN